MPSSLSRETDPDHRLFDLLCPLIEGCPAPVAGWTHRATLALGRHAGDRAHRMHQTLPRPADCEAEAMAAEAEERFRRWYACAATLEPAQASLPLGGIRVPDEGWLIIEGTRGHYGPCDEVRAYDLGTGSAYRASRCAGLAARPVDREGRIDVEGGRLGLPALREAGWMILMADEVDLRSRPGATGCRCPTPSRPQLRATGCTEVGGGDRWAAALRPPCDGSTFDRVGRSLRVS